MDNICEEAEMMTANIGGSVLPDPEMVNFYRHAKERKLWIDMEVGVNMLEFARMIMLWNMEDKNIAKDERKPIWLYVMNYGGSADMVNMFIDVMEASATPVYTVNIGVAASAGALFFIAGHKRFMMKNAKVIIHEGSAEFGGDAVKIIDQTESYKAMLKKTKEYILNHTNIPKRDLMKKRNNDWEIDAAYCIENGVADCLVESLDDII